MFVLQHRGVEQLVARRAHNPKVVGSSPAPATYVYTNPRRQLGVGGFVFVDAFGLMGIWSQRPFVNEFDDR